MKKVVLIFMLVVLSYKIASSKTIDVVDSLGNPSCEYEDVNTAIQGADPGDTVVVPSGLAIWTTALSITKDITLMGAGIDNTVITANGITALISVSISGDHVIDISGFTLDANSNIYGISITNTSTTTPIYNLRIHHNRILNAVYAIKPHGMIYGCIDNNQFHNNTYDLKPLGIPADDESWVLFPGVNNIGTKNYLYIEDNTSTASGDTIIMSSGEGARWVYRYNTVDASIVGDKLFDAHGDTLNRGVVAHEIYENTITNMGSRLLMDSRGGTVINFNNTFYNANGWGGRSQVREGHFECTSPTGCDGSPCGDEINNSYIWDNKWNDGTPCGLYEYDEYGCIEEDDAWWDDYDDNNFVSGIAANKPGTCTDDDCYWETDTKKLYRCIGANNWTFVYAPYTYPHPIRQEAPQDVPKTSKGDLNGDDIINIQDVQACVNHINGVQDYGDVTDVNEDGRVNEADIKKVVDIIFGK